MEWIAHRLRQTPRLWDFILHHGDLTPTLPAEIHGHSLPVFHEGTPLLRQVQDAMHWTRTIADYDASCDTSVTALPALFEARKGTAGDLAHLLIALVRKWQVPARFVSGYIDAAYFDVDGEPTGEHPPCPQSIHHWAEVLIPGGGWVGFDPALDLLADATYMRVAVGRDGKDIQALRQNCKGQAADIEFDETLSVSRISA
nr:transglutaminase family protein [Thiocystis violacea]